MGEAAQTVDEQAYVAQLNEAQAIKAKQLQPAPKRPQGRVIAFPGVDERPSSWETQGSADEEGGQVIRFPTGESRGAMAERLNADRAQAASQKSSLGFDLNVERLSEAGNINQQRMDEASARVADLTQRMREATTLAEIQSLRLDYLALNRELTEEGLENQVDKLKDEARAWMWRFAADSGPAIDACTFGTDFGMFTVASDAVVTFQFVYGSALGGREEPSYLHNMFVPSPTRVKPADNDPDARSIKKVVMKWWDIMVFVLNYIGWTPLIFTLGIVAVILIYVGLVCLNPDNAVAALQDDICQVFASSVSQAGGVGAITGTAAGN